MITGFWIAVTGLSLVMFLVVHLGGVLLAVVDPPAFERYAASLHQQLGALVAGHPDLVESVRGQGLLFGIKMRTPLADVITAARANGLVVLPAGDNVVRLLPPLTLSEDEAREGMELLNKTASQLDAQKAAAQ